MNTHCSFAVSLSHAPKGRAHGKKTPPTKAAKFARTPSWVSLKSTPPVKKTYQSNETQVEFLSLASLARGGKLQEALELLEQMEKAGTFIKPYTYSLLFKACAKTESLLQGRLIHKLMQRTIKDPPWYLEFSVFDMYCKCGSLVYAQKVFEEMSERNSVAWVTIISVYAKEGFLETAVRLFSEMPTYEIEPNPIVYANILRSLLNPSHLELGKQWHSHAIRSGLGDSVSVNTGICHVYMRCGWLEGAELVFRRMSDKGVVTCTALMGGYIQADRPKDALALFKYMVIQRAEFDSYVFSTVLKATASLEDLSFGKQIHGHVVKLGFESDVSAGTPLVDFYVKCSDFESAFKAFDRISEPNDFSWSALVTGYCQIGKFEEPLKIFQSLRKKGADINPYTYTNIFQACSALADFTSGTQVHADAIKRNLVARRYGDSAVITMYAKCGRLGYARRAFESIGEPDTVAWTALIAGYAYEGNVAEALKLFRRMQDYGVGPNAVTFTVILTACSYSGLVDEGKQYFHSMSNNYGVAPNIDHFNCMIDIYSRAGLLQEAFELIRSMPFAPDATSWKCLLSGCWTYRNLKIGKIAAENLFHLAPEDSAGYDLMFNLYASAGKWEEAAAIRKIMAEKHLEKELSCCWITVNGEVHRFIVGDKHHPLMEEIYTKLKELNDSFEEEETVLLKEEDVSGIFAERQEQLLDHSERLAIAFGLISTPSNAPIFIFKNLRACRDCHDFAKHVSVVTGRKIVVRDSLRFLTFKFVQCSCNDYW
ncbi:hypothetical protein Tsubulata_004533 [Turnera subulata]|uniref:DYW domain-containing protein n=1 Tax=Turnera subulata TaxID=218843 RepID=A0A9Q0JQ96_9ROSI|nr:hypothetical protein Tsubulata_004533 [Turnera subulata]